MGAILIGHRVEIINARLSTRSPNFLWAGRRGEVVGLWRGLATVQLDGPGRPPGRTALTVPVDHLRVIETLAEGSDA